MASFKKIRELLVEIFVDGEINEDEFVLLYNANTSKNPIFPYENYEKFDFDSLDPAECKAEFRFEKRDLPSLLKSYGSQKCSFATKELSVMVWRAYLWFSGGLHIPVATAI